MTAQIVDSPGDFFAALGGLHDSWIESVIVRPGAKTLSLGIDDLNANFLGLPEYQGERPCSLAFDAVSQVALALSMHEGVRISKLFVEGEPGRYRVTINLNLGGLPSDADSWRMTALFGSLSIIESSICP